MGWSGFQRRQTAGRRLHLGPSEAEKRQNGFECRADNRSPGREGGSLGRSLCGGQATLAMPQGRAGVVSGEKSVVADVPAFPVGHRRRMADSDLRHGACVGQWDLQPLLGARGKVVTAWASALALARLSRLPSLVPVCKSLPIF